MGGAPPPLPPNTEMNSALLPKKAEARKANNPYLKALDKQQETCPNMTAFFSGAHSINKYAYWYIRRKLGGHS
jgi:hypothetical protein